MSGKKSGPLWIVQEIIIDEAEEYTFKEPYSL